MTDAFAYIDSRVQKLVQDNVESSDLIEQQRTVMLREQFHAMITNADAANEADTDQLENLGFPIHRAKQYYLLAYRLQEQDLANEKDPDKIYEMQWFILQNVTRAAVWRTFASVKAACSFTLSGPRRKTQRCLKAFCGAMNIVAAFWPSILSFAMTLP